MKIGNDIVKISRMENFFNNKHLFNRVFSPSEQQYILDVSTIQQRYERMAGKIALKEAVAKAFGVGIGKELGWLDVVSDHLEGGKPVVLKTEKLTNLLNKFGFSNLDVSISHMDDYATAVCVLF